MKPITLYLGVLLASTLLSGCAINKDTDHDTILWQDHHHRLQQLTDWRIKGKLGLRLPSDNNSANIDWNNQDQSYTIRLSGPLQMGTTYIQGERDWVWMEQTGKPKVYAQSPEKLLLQETGWQLPVTSLRYWIKGIPAPTSKATNLRTNEFGALEAFQQMGWQLHYLDYRKVNALHLPRKLVATYEKIKLTLVIRSWKVPSTDEQDV